MDTHINRQLLVAALFVAVASAGCGAKSGTNSPAPPNVVSPTSNVLQLAVGTATIYGVQDAGTNVVATYRQANGDSGSAVNSPTLTIPETLAGPAGTPDGSFATIATGPATGEIGGSNLTSTSQSAGVTTVTTFGTSQGVFATGIEPYNYTQLGVPYSVAPNPLPVYDAKDPNQLPNAWCGPPACDLLGNGQSPVGNGNVPGGTAGIGSGLDVFAGLVPVASGSYSLSVSVPANTGTVTQTKAFTLPATLTSLPAFTTPVAAQNTDGSASFTFALPAGVTEAFIEIVDIGPVPVGGTQAANCNGAANGNPIYYTIAVTRSPASLGPAAGPGGAPTLCTAAQNTAAAGAATSGDQFVVYGIGFDYPAYQINSFVNPGVQAPAILGGNNEDDITISTPIVYYEPAAAAGLASKPRGAVRLQSHTVPHSERARH